MKSSILIITRNRPQALLECLQALYSEIRKNENEVVVVDSSPGHDTRELIKKFDWVTYYPVQLPPGTRPQSYTFGAKKCRGEIVVLLDDDAIVFPGWLKAIEACYDDPKVGAAGGRVLSRDQELTAPETESHDFPIGVVNPDGTIISNLHRDPGARRQVDTLRGCNMSVRRDLLEKVRYFDNRYRGQNCRVEDDVCLGIKRMGYEVIFEPKAVVRHLAEERADIPRSEKNMRSEFYVARNTVWLYVKHFGFSPDVVFKVGVLNPCLTGLRRIMGGSMKSPKITLEGLSYFPSAAAGIAGGLWGIVESASNNRPVSAGGVS